jgi:TP901 family phage tail tape measure protein
MCDTLPTVLNLAAASDMVTDAMSALGMGVDEAGTMVDQMAKTASSTNTSVAQLGEGILTIGATAKTVKGGTAELNTALGILANNGIKGAEGGTHLRNVILSLQNPTDKAAACMEQLGLDVYDSEGNMRSLNDILGDLNTSMDGMTAAEKSNIIGQIFNKTDLSSVNALLANTGSTWDDLQQSIIDSGGAAQQMADTQLDNLQGQITILKSALEGLAISFGELLLPAIKMIVGWVQKFVDWLNGMDEGTKKVITTVALLAAALGPVLIVVGKVVSAVGTIMTIVPKVAGVINTVKTAFAALNTTMLANPIFLIIAAITALVAAFIYLWNTNEDFRQFWINLWENVKEVAIAVWEAIKNFFSAAWEAISSTAQAVWNGIKDFFSGLWEGIKTVVTTVVTAIQTFITTAWNAIKNTVTTVLNAIKTVITTVWNGIKSAVTTVVNAIKNVISTVWNGIKNTVSTVVNGIKNTVSTVFNNIKSSISGTMGNIVSVIKSGFNNAISFITSLPSKALQWGKDMIMGIVNGIKSCIGAVGDAVSSVANKIKSFLHFSVPDEGPLTDYESWMPDFMKGLAKGIEDSKSMVARAMDGVAADMILNPSAAVQEISVSGNGGDEPSQGGPINGPLIEVKEMNVRSEEDIRKISQQLYRQLQQGRRANGYS